MPKHEYLHQGVYGKKPKIPGKSYQEPTCSDPHHLS